MKILKSFIEKGRVTSPKLGTVISIVGADGGVAYVEASATPNVKVLYVGTTSIFKVVAIVFKINMPEDFENILSFPWHRLYDFYFIPYGIKVEVVVVVAQIVVVVDVVVIHVLSSATVSRAASRTA